jgi:predicted RNase H-like nuclease (RuvC/YqgF family)
MFSNLSQNSILYILDLNSNPKILSGPIERVTIPRPKYNTFNPNMEMIVDIIATINGEKREFKGVPNSSIANFGTDAFILAESKESLNSYINSMLQNSKNIIDSIDKHKKLVEDYETALQELNPSLKADKEKDKAIQNLQEQVNSLQDGMKQLLAMMGKNETIKQN